MGEGFIVRKGGGGKQTLAPTITEISTTSESITFTITNNDVATAVILWEIGDSTPDENSIELAAGATTNNIIITELDDDTQYTVSATANVTDKIKSNVTQLTITTEPIIYTAATGGTTLEYDLDSKRYRSHTFTSDGDFVITNAGNNERSQIDYLVIAGGAAGGRGGGGAGGYQTSFGVSGANSDPLPSVTATLTTYEVVVGAGGSSSAGFGNNGNNSSVFSTISIGGGTGARVGNAASIGGSGGGGASGYTTGAIGTANQGRQGGNNNTSGCSAGGGGALNNGASNITVNTGSGGGAGIANLLRTGSNETRAGGGGGGGANAGGGGAGGGGAGSRTGGFGNPTSASSGAVNRGSGGGGDINSGQIPGTGGSGIVIIRYEIAPSV
jgi:hypothetical protein